TIVKSSIPDLAKSDLAEQVELVKFSPIVLNLEELSKLWSVFFQTAYRLSVAYQASVVLIESEETPRIVLPVRKPNIVVLPFHSPIIDQIISSNGSNLPILPDGTILITGRNLRGDDTRVRIAGELVAPQEVSNVQITLPLAPLSDKLRAGVQSVQVVHIVFSGPPPYGFESNVAAFVLRPFFTSNDVGFDAATGTITINSIEPRVGATQRIVLLLNEIVDPPVRLPNSYSFSAEPRTRDTDPIEFKIKNVAPGDYLVRVQIDGAENIDIDEQGNFVWPRVPITQSLQRTLTTSAAPAGSGNIARNPDKPAYNNDESVALTATPTTGFRFVQWSGDLGSANPSDTAIMVVMNQNRTLTARFEAIPPDQLTLTTSVAPSGSGSVARNPNKPAYNNGESVVLTATPTTGFRFVEWGGDLSGAGNPATITMHSNKQVTAIFAETGGQQITFEEIKTGESSDSDTVATSERLTGVSGHLYLAAISTKPHGEVTNVTGLGLTWTRVRSLCAGRNRTGIQMWRAQGTPSGDGAVTAILSDTPENVVIAVSRYSGVATDNPIGNVISGNTNGLDGACSGGDDSDAFSFDFTTTADKAVLYGAIAMRQRRHTPGQGYTKRGELSTGTGGDDAGLFVEDKHVPSVGTIMFDGSFSDEVDWAVLALEIRPRTS
ncbi:MAG: Pvc16 family protein, partial [Anaerolineae bacterium]|nr:Pvc16 family protein [Anaerolineae bacterium]